MGQPTPPTPPTAGQSYASGIKAYLKYLPQLLGGEQSARALYDPQRIQSQLDLQSKYGPQQYDQQLAALHQLDPTGTQLRTDLGNRISSDLNLGTSLSPELDQQLTGQIRAAQAARGNDLGSDAISAEGLFKGQAALNLEQQRIQNAGNFLAGPTPEQQLLTVNPVTPDRSSQYVNPNAGYAGQQFGLQNYQNVLAQYQLSGGGRNPWIGAAGGAASGAASGASFGPYGAIIGGVAGGALGYFSSRLLKERIVTVGQSPSGIPVVEFSYKSEPNKRYRGVIAEDVLAIKPEAVGERDGFLTVDYDQIDVNLEEVR